MYEKRLCILKQLKSGFSADGSPLSGAIYLEQWRGEVTLTPKIVGLSPLFDGRYALCLGISGKYFCVELQGSRALRIPDAPPIENGFSALVCFVKGEAEPVAFGSCGKNTDSPALLLSLLSRKTKPKQEPAHSDPPPARREEAPPVPQDEIGAQNEEKAQAAEEQAPQEERISGAPKYDDEAIASSDYYKESEEGKDEGSCGEGAEESVHPFAFPKGDLVYYRSIEQKLLSAMQKFPKDETLKRTFPQSEWVKTESGLLGVIYEAGQPRYLCVAMACEPPKEVARASVFVPTSPFDETAGMYVVFQDADTGDYVTVQDG